MYQKYVLYKFVPFSNSNDSQPSNSANLHSRIHITDRGDIQLSPDGREQFNQGGYEVRSVAAGERVRARARKQRERRANQIVHKRNRKENTNITGV